VVGGICWLLGLVFLTLPHVNMCFICNVVDEFTFLLLNVMCDIYFSSMLLSGVHSTFFYLLYSYFLVLLPPASQLELNSGDIPCLWRGGLCGCG